MKDFCEINDLVESVECRMQDAYEQGYETGHKDGEARGIDKMNNLSKEAYIKGLEDAWECIRKILLGTTKGGIHADDLCEIFGTLSAAEILETVSVDEAIQKIKEYEYKQKKERCKTCEYYKGGFDCHHFCEPYNFDNYKEKQEPQNKKCEDCFTEKLTKEKWVSAKDCKDCKKMKMNCEDCTKEISAECVVDGCEFESKQTDATDIEIKVGDEVVFCDSFHGARYVVVRIRDDGTFDALCDCGTDNGLDLKKCHKTGKHFPQIAEVLELLKGKE